MVHDGLSDPREHENGDLTGRERHWLMWYIVALGLEKGGLLVVGVIGSCKRPHDVVQDGTATTNLDPRVYSDPSLREDQHKNPLLAIHHGDHYF